MLSTFVSLRRAQTAIQSEKFEEEEYVRVSCKLAFVMCRASCVCSLMYVVIAVEAAVCYLLATRGIKVATRELTSSLRFAVVSNRLVLASS